jgi:hypothetical protein
VDLASMIKEEFDCAKEQISGAYHQLLDYIGENLTRSKEKMGMLTRHVM